MLDQILVIVSVTGLVMLTPGPDMVLVLRNTLVGGRRTGLQTSMGILSGNLVHIWLVFVCTLDRPVIREFVERSQQTVNRISGVVLLLLGVRVAAMTR